MTSGMMRRVLVLGIVAVAMTAFADQAHAQVRVRLQARLSPTAEGRSASGKAAYDERGTKRKLSIEVQHAPRNAILTVTAGGQSFSLATDALGVGKVELKTEAGQSVPELRAGSRVSVAQGTTTLLVGTMQ